MSKPKKGKRFVYSLETLLKVRGIRERQQQEKFNEAEKKVKEEERKEAQMKKEQQEHLTYVRELLSSDELPSMTTIEMHQQHVFLFLLIALHKTKFAICYISNNGHT